MKKILIIEDNLDIRENVAELLGLEGYEVSTACNGKEGLEVATRETPDLVLCDVMMPELDGYEVLEQLRAQNTGPLIPFIFLTAKAERADIHHGLSRGALSYLVKPFSDDELINAIANGLLNAG